jgi:hypothetical protein
MFKKTLFAILITLTSIGHAETCPSVDDIKNHNLKNWKAYTLENGTVPSHETMKLFTENIHQFMLAEWMDEAPEGSGHCYYERESPDDNYLGVYLAKQNMAPNKSSAWVKKGLDVMHCTLGIDVCEFIQQ